MHPVADATRLVAPTQVSINTGYSALKKPFAVVALGNNRVGVGYRSWVTTWILFSIKTLQPSKGLLGTRLISSIDANESKYLR